MKRIRLGTEDEFTRSDSTARPQQQQPSPPPQNRAATERDEGSNNPPKLAQFLERCHYCKKHIPQNKEVFMYKDFCGFCSVGCRDIQISLDKLSAKQAELAVKLQAAASCKDQMDQCKEMDDMESQYTFK